MRLFGVLVTTPSSKSAGQGFESWIIDEQFSQLLIFPALPGRENGHVGKPGDGKLLETGCQTCPVSLGNEMLPTTGSRGKDIGLSTEATRSFNLHPQLPLLMTTTFEI